MATHRVRHSECALMAGTALGIMAMLAFANPTHARVRSEAAGQSGAAQSEETSPATLSIADARFAHQIVDRQPTDEPERFFVGDVIYLWMHVKGGPADPIEVTWTSGDFSYSATLAIGSPSWRTWAKKTLFKPGTWTVTVTDAEGTSLWTRTFEVEPGHEPEADDGQGMQGE